MIYHYDRCLANKCQFLYSSDNLFIGLRLTDLRRMVRMVPNWLISSRSTLSGVTYGNTFASYLQNSSKESQQKDLLNIEVYKANGTVLPNWQISDVRPGW